MPTENDRYIATWLIICAITIFSMILLGGVTRLTQSGLSMVEWKPITGVIPPLTETQWQTEFEKYKAYPEYQKVNINMTLPEFKKIFYFEYGHRVLGRFIGLLFLIPFLFFYFSKRIRPGLTPKLIAMFILGGLQGLLGWYMVKSGLVNEPRVSQFRLTAHLGAAVIIYGYILWVAFDLLFPHSINKNKYISNFSVMLTTLIFIMILSGGFVAGTRAGHAYNTFPLMAGSFIPDGLFNLEPWWKNFFYNITTIQFNHRMLAYIIVLLSVVFIVQLWRNKPEHLSDKVIYSFLAVLALQISLGILTLLHVVPTALAASHQSGAILLFTVILFICHQLRIKSS